MKTSVLLDTSFLISLVDGHRPNHRVAVEYYQFLLGQQIPMYFSAIVAAEFGVKQSITDLPLRNFRPIPFNVPHGQVAGALWSDLSPHEAGVSRRVARDDVKLIAQACHEKIPFILTEDASTLLKYCDRLRAVGRCRTRAIALAEGFDVCAFNEDGQQGLDLVAD